MMERSAAPAVWQAVPQGWRQVVSRVSAVPPAAAARAFARLGAAPAVRLEEALPVAQQVVAPVAPPEDLPVVRQEEASRALRPVALPPVGLAASPLERVARLVQPAVSQRALALQEVSFFCPCHPPFAPAPGRSRTAALPTSAQR
jgi:hypothetical protein